MMNIKLLYDENVDINFRAHDALLE